MKAATLTLDELLHTAKGRWMALDVVEVKNHRNGYRPILNFETHDKLLAAWESPEISPTLLLAHVVADDKKTPNFFIEKPSKRKIPPQKDKIRWGRFLHNVATCYNYLNYPFASELYDNALKIFETDKRAESYLLDVLLNYGVASMTGYREDIPKAERLLSRAFDISEKNKRLDLVAIFGYELAYALLFQRKFEQACLHLLRALEAAILTANKMEIEGDLQVLSRIAIECMKTENEWRELLTHGLDELETLGGDRLLVETILKEEGMFSRQAIYEKKSSKLKKIDGVTPLS